MFRVTKKKEEEEKEEEKTDRQTHTHTHTEMTSFYDTNGSLHSFLLFFVQHILSFKVLPDMYLCVHM